MIKQKCAGIRLMPNPNPNNIIDNEILKYFAHHL